MFFTKEKNIYLLSEQKVYKIDIKNGKIFKQKTDVKYEKEDLFTVYELKCRYSSLFNKQEEQNDLKQEEQDDLKQEEQEDKEEQKNSNNKEK